MSHLRILCLGLCLIFAVSASGQKSPFKKADKFYAEKSYARAIPLYEAALEGKNSLSAKNKLANCYRLTNQTGKARALYAEIVTNDRANPRTFFYYGESLMQIGKYDEARAWFLKYAELKPDDEKGLKMAEACEKVKLIQPVLPNAKITFFPENSDSDDTAPVFYKNGIVFSTDRESGIKVLKGKSDWTGRGNVHLFFSEQLEDTVFTKPSNFSMKLNSAKKNTGTASFSTDESEVFFSRNSWETNKNGLYTMQLYSSTISNGGKWKDVEALSFCSIKYNYMHPSVSADGKKLFFISDKPGGLGGMDIYVSNRVGRGWKRPENLGENVNTDGHEGFPFFFADGRLYFCSKGHDGFGGFDIFYTEQDTAGVWQKPINLGQPINSSFDDVSFHLAPDASKGLFTSGREGGDDDIFLIELSEISTDQLVNRVHMAEAMKQYVESAPPKPAEAQPAIESTPSTPVAREPMEIVEEASPVVNSNQPQVETPPAVPSEIKETIEQSKNNMGTFVQTEASPNNGIREEPAVKDVITEAIPQPKVEMAPPVMEEKVNAIEQTAPVNTKQQPLAKPQIATKEKTKKKSKKKKKKKKHRKNKTPQIEEIKRVAIMPETTARVVAEMDKSPRIKPGIMIIEEVLVKQASYIEDRQIPMPTNEKKQPAIINQSTARPTQANNETSPWPNQPALAGNDRTTDVIREKVISKSTIFNSNFFEELKTNYSENVNDEGKVFKISQLYYVDGDYKITEELANRLDQLVVILNNNPTIDLEVRSHTESIGDDQQNLMLSELRAHTVRNYLIRRGVKERRLAYRGYGESELLNTCDNDADCNPSEHRVNQRMEIKILKY